MANNTKSKKTTNTEVPKTDLPLYNDRKKQIKLGIGILLMLSGVFICLSIISYYYSWTADQDNFFANKSLLSFIFSSDRTPTPVANWGGRMGAALAHALVYRGAGIASITLGLAIGGIGLNLIYEKKAAQTLKYIRWSSLIILLIAPILTYLFPTTPFPIGGAWGNVAIDYFNGLLGKMGTGLVLLSILLFFIFVVFALDIRPFLKKMQEKAALMAASLQPKESLSKNDDPKEEEENTGISENTAPKVAAVSIPSSAAAQNKMANVEDDDSIVEDDYIHANEVPISNKLKGDISAHTLIIENELPQKDLGFNVVEKQAALHNNTPYDEAIDDEEEYCTGDDIEDDLLENGIYSAHYKPEGNDVEEAAPNYDEDIEPWDDEADDDIEEERQEEPQTFSFEVKQQAEEKPVIKHGAHISIASNEPYAPELDLPDYKFPTLDLLENRSEQTISLNKEELERNKDQIIQTLSSFGIEIQQISATIGPTVTLYEIVPAKGVRISKIKNLEDDIALSLAALGIRIIAPIPGKGTIGIEVPNANKQIVSMQALLASDKFVNNKMSLPIALGKKIDNENYIVDLATMPHLLMAGATGQGKSVGINAILVSLLYKKHPSQLKFVMVDPKKVELSIYRTIEKHFLAKLPNEEEAIITDIKKVIYTLKALCDEMDDRYGLLKEAGTRNIKEYNEKFIARKLNPENGHKYLPFIVLVIDEFADLIMTAGKEVEMPIARLAQLARAVGIHLIIATQRPSVNVITGTIKANFPARIAFKVSAKVDSRTILDTGGAEQLVGRGDMLISHGSELLRLQCAFVDTPEVENVVNFIGSQRGYPKAHPLPEPEMDDDDGGSKSFDFKNRDKLFEDCARMVVQMQSGSTSNLQRKFNLGYNRAGRIMDQLEAANIVGPAVGSKPREVYFKTESELEGFLSTLK